MPPHHHHHHGHHHGRHGPGFGAPLGALLVGGMIGGAVASATRPPPPARYQRGHRYRQVIVVHQVPQGMPPIGPSEQLVSVACPIGARPGDPLEIEVEGKAYSITIPQVREGQSFYARIPKHSIAVPVVVEQPPPVAPTPPVYQARSAQPPPQQPQPQQQLPTAAVVSNSNAVEAQAQVVGTLPPSPTSSGATNETFASSNPFMDEDESADDWVIAPSKAEFDSFFTAAGPTQKNGQLVLSPAQVRGALLPTGLPKEVLRSVWELSDIDKVDHLFNCNGVLDIDEFAVSMYLCRLSLSGQPLPASLPQNVVPPSKRNPF